MVLNSVLDLIGLGQDDEGEEAISPIASVELKKAADSVLKAVANRTPEEQMHERQVQRVGAFGAAHCVVFDALFSYGFLAQRWMRMISPTTPVIGVPLTVHGLKQIVLADVALGGAVQAIGSVGCCEGRVLSYRQHQASVVVTALSAIVTLPLLGSALSAVLYPNKDAIKYGPLFWLRRLPLSLPLAVLGTVRSQVKAVVVKYSGATDHMVTNLDTAPQEKKTVFEAYGPVVYSVIAGDVITNILVLPLEVMIVRYAARIMHRTDAAGWYYERTWTASSLWEEGFVGSLGLAAGTLVVETMVRTAALFLWVGILRTISSYVDKPLSATVHTQEELKPKSEVPRSDIYDGGNRIQVL